MRYDWNPEQDGQDNRPAQGKQRELNSGTKNAECGHGDGKSE